MAAVKVKHKTSWKVLKEGADGYRKPETCDVRSGRGPCERPAVECVEDHTNIKEPKVLTLCKECRLLSFGKTPAEKTADTKAFKARQESLFPMEKR